MIGQLIMATSWTAAYALIIHRSFRDKTHGMPFPALCFNIAWEGMMLFLLERGSLIWYVVLLWFLLDGVILLQYFAYARPKERSTFSTPRERLFWISSLALLAVGIGTTITVTIRFDDSSGAISAYSMNALMSILFCTMLLKRNSLEAQGLYIAILKFLGTAITFTYIDLTDPLILWFGVVIAFFDLSYIALVCMIGKRDGIKLLLRI